MHSQKFLTTAPVRFVRQATCLRSASAQLTCRETSRFRPICYISNNIQYGKGRRIYNNSDFNSSFLNTPLCVKNQVQVKRAFSDNAFPNHHKVILPNLSPTMESGTIVSWEKEEGERINEGDVLAMIETDKATMEMETPEEGYLAKILLPAGTKDVAVKQVICIIVEDEEDVAAFTNYAVQSEEDDKPLESKEIKETQVIEEVNLTEEKPKDTDKVTKLSEPLLNGRIIASPMAKKEATKLGINLEDIKGTGPDGRITSSDVTSAFEMLQSQPKATSPVLEKSFAEKTTSQGGFVDIELSNMRKTIAKRLLEAKQTIPHYYLSVDVEMDDVLKLRQELNSIGKDEFKISVNDFIIKAASLALKKVPECNSSWMDDFVRKYNNVDVSVAVSTDGGLITPIVFDADKKGLAEISDNIRSLAEKARNKLLQPSEFMGGTFTISNLGMFGIKNFSAVINPPQSCILAVGTTVKQLLPDENSDVGFRSANVMSVTLSCDHRVVDGAVGAQWLQYFQKYLQQPTTMLL